MKRLITTLAAGLAGLATLASSTNACPPSPCGQYPAGYYRHYVPGFDEEFVPEIPGGRFIVPGNGGVPRTALRPNPGDPGVNVGPNGTIPTPKAIQRPDGQRVSFTPGNNGVFPGRPGGGITPNAGNGSVAIGPNGRTPQFFQDQAPGGGRPGGGITPNAGNGGVAIGPNGRTPQFIQKPTPGGGRPGGGITPNAGNGGVAIGPNGRTPQFFQNPAPGGGSGSSVRIPIPLGKGNAGGSTARRTNR